MEKRVDKKEEAIHWKQDTWPISILFSVGRRGDRRCRAVRLHKANHHCRRDRDSLQSAMRTTIDAGRAYRLFKKRNSSFAMFRSRKKPLASAGFAGQKRGSLSALFARGWVGGHPDGVHAVLFFTICDN